MKFIKRNWQKLILAAYTFFVPLYKLYAETIGTEAPGGRIVDPLGERYKSIPALIQTILEGVLKIGIPIVALAVVYCGFLFVFARGKPEELKKAKDALLWTLVGAAILLGSWAIAKMISATVLSL